ncbi:uncharacterized protein V6R79_006092 [Siganus canaliculatus]
MEQPRAKRDALPARTPSDAPAARPGRPSSTRFFFLVPSRAARLVNVSFVHGGETALNPPEGPTPRSDILLLSFTLC